MYRRARSARLNAARIYQTEHLGQNLNAATQGLFQEFLFRRNKTVFINAAVKVFAMTSRAQGVTRKRKMLPSLSALIAVSGSAIAGQNNAN